MFTEQASSVISFPVSANEEIRALKERVDRWEVLHSEHGVRIAVVEDKIERAATQNSMFPKAIDGLREAVSALTVVVDAQRKESIDRHTDTGRMYLEMLDSLAEMRIEVSNGSADLSKHKKNEGILVRGVVILSGVILAPISMAIVAGWDTQIRPALVHTLSSFLGG